MRGLPVVDISSENLCHVAREAGSFYLQHPLFPAERCGFAIEAARVFFSMRAEAKRMGAGVIGHTAQIALHDVEVDHQCWCIQIVNVH